MIKLPALVNDSIQQTIGENMDGSPRVELVIPREVVWKYYQSDMGETLMLGEYLQRECKKACIKYGLDMAMQNIHYATDPHAYDEGIRITFVKQQSN